MKIASLDLGSNSFLLLISEVIDKKVTQVFHDEQQVTRLGQGVHANRSLHPEALARAEECFQYYSKIIEKHSPDKVMAVSTSAARDASNQEEFLQLGKKYGIPIKIIPGQVEAELTYLGTLDSLDAISEKEGVAVLDIGGGSTEVIASQKGKIVGHSIDIGSVRLSEIFSQKDQLNVSDIKKLDEYIFALFKEKQSVLPQFSKLIAVAGTPTTLSCLIQGIEFDVNKVDNASVSLSQIEHFRDEISLMPLADRKKLKGVPEKRADVLPYGLSILYNFCLFFGVNEILVSTKGVRYGVAIETSTGSLDL